MAEAVGAQVVSAVVQEAIGEVSGTSNRKWAVVLLAVVLGAAVACVFMKRRGEQSPAESEPQPSA